MKFTLKNYKQTIENNSCAVIGIFKNEHLSKTASQLNKNSNEYISNLLKQGEFNGYIGNSLILYNIPNIPYKKILIVGCGNENELDSLKYKQIVYLSIKKLINTGSTNIDFYLIELNVLKINTYWKIRKSIESIHESLYSFDQLKTKKNNIQLKLKKISFIISEVCEIDQAKIAIKHGVAISNGINAAKNLGNLPPNICNSSYLLCQSSILTKRYNTKTKLTVLNEKQMQNIGMNAYVSVGKGSNNPSLMCVIHYEGCSSNVKPIILVGKGLTFDTGGISIKPSMNMDKMKYDMCGAAAVYGTLLTAMELNLSLNIIGIIASCENMIDSYSIRPGDIIKTMSGKTVEIINTDAEGRLVLCDVLTYVEKFNPEVVIDIATLTGACAISLGKYFTGLMSNHNPLINELLSCSNKSGDHVWHLPLTHELNQELNSNFADMSNIGSNLGGAIIAGYFLSKFTNKYNWAHLDIAGTAWHKDKNKGATGRPVGLLSQFLLNREKLNRN
ncbi:MAG: leucyl aminopeptidase [Enterobacterales bacterium]